MYIIKLPNCKDNCYIAGWSFGDPPRTLDFESAKKFKTLALAEKELKEVKKNFPNREYKIVKID